MRARSLLLLLALLPAGCGSSPPTQFYTLTAMPETGRVFGAAGKPLMVGHIQLPGDLDRDNLVTRSGPNRLNVSDQDRWAGPLDEMIQRVLATDLAARLPSGMVLAPGDPAPPRGARTLAVNVRQFMGDAAGQVALDVDWSLLAGNPQHPVLRRQESLMADAGSAHPAAIVAAMSRVLGELSERMAGTVARTR